MIPTGTQSKCKYSWEVHNTKITNISTMRGMPLLLALLKTFLSITWFCFLQSAYYKIGIPKKYPRLCELGEGDLLGLCNAMDLTFRFFFLSPSSILGGNYIELYFITYWLLKQILLQQADTAICQSICELKFSVWNNTHVQTYSFKGKYQ